MKKAIFISLAKVLIVWLADKVISYVTLKAFHALKDMTATDVVNLASNKYYSILAVNVLCSILLYFALRRFSMVSAVAKVILCTATIIVNGLIMRYP